MQRKKMLIIGGGFGGLYLAKSLGNQQIDITLVDRRNFHLFQPLLYQVATGGLSPANIAYPIRAILKKYKNIKVLMDEAFDIDPEKKFVKLKEGGRLDFDYCVVATGSTHHYFGNKDWEKMAPGLKTVEDATEIRRRILLAYEKAEKEKNKAKQKELLTFCVVGGGPTGVELAGALSDIASEILKNDFRSINKKDVSIKLLEGSDRILTAYPKDLSLKAQKSLEKLGVEVSLESIVSDVNEKGLKYKKNKKEKEIKSHTILWAAGVRISSFGEKLKEKEKIKSHSSGRIIVTKNLNLENYPHIFVIGDLAHYEDEKKGILPGIAPVAMQEGKYLADYFKKALKEKKEIEEINYKAFRYHNKGQMATIGRSKAVAMIGKLHFSGRFAWLLWLIVHLLFILQFGNKILILIQWFWNYLSPDRAARLITQEEKLFDT